LNLINKIKRKVKKAGGIIAIIAGVFGVIAAIVTLFIGGVGSALDGEGANVVIGLGWGGILFSFLTIIFGAVALNAKNRVPGNFAYSVRYFRRYTRRHFRCNFYGACAYWRNTCHY
jgi:hypothetical protein